MNFLGMGPAELVLVAALALIVFGPDKLPDIARQIGRTVGELRRVTSEVNRELQRSMREEPSGSGPRIVRQPTSVPPPVAAPTPSTPSEPTTEPTPPPPATDAAGTGTPTILPPKGGAPAPASPATQGSWEDGPDRGRLIG